MGLFRKKSRDSDVVVAEVESDERSDVPREVNTKGSKRSSSRSLGKWLGGGSSKKLGKKDKKKSSPKSTSPGQHRSTKISHSTSTSSSGKDDARDDRPQMFFATSSKADPPEAKIYRQKDKDTDSLVNSLCSLPPPAAQAAFDGPPRFDWIDIEYNAATMIQSTFRRHVVLRAMEASGMTTSYIRNRKRQRKARTFFQSDDETAPTLGFGCCLSMDFCGNDFDAADDVAYKHFQRQQYEERKKAQKEREEFLSNSYFEQKGLDSSLLKVERAQTREDLRRF